MEKNMRILFLPLVLCVLVLSGCQSAQEKPVKEAPISSKTLGGFMGIVWGDSPAAAKQRIRMRRDGALLYRENPFMLCFRDGELLGEHVDLLRLYFYSKGFYSATAHVTTLTPSEVDRYYQKLKGMITSKYGEPHNDVQGNCRWRFTDDCVITIEYSSGVLGIYYLNMKMSGDALVEEKLYDRQSMDRDSIEYFKDL
jgi:hypothetical protein